MAAFNYAIIIYFAAHDDELRAKKYEKFPLDPGQLLV